MYNSGIGTPYWFEWEIGILECLKMLHDTSIESVVLQSTNFQVLDDVVVNYVDKSIINIQVKHTDTDVNFTYSFLYASSVSASVIPVRIENDSCRVFPIVRLISSSVILVC